MTTTVGFIAKKEHAVAARCLIMLDYHWFKLASSTRSKYWLEGLTAA
jgi:hypothetical protein